MCGLFIRVKNNLSKIFITFLGLLQKSNQIIILITLFFKSFDSLADQRLKPLHNFLKPLH
jgi:hypothetical protein